MSIAAYDRATVGTSSSDWRASSLCTEISALQLTSRLCCAAKGAILASACRFPVLVSVNCFACLSLQRCQYSTISNTVVWPLCSANAVGYGLKVDATALQRTHRPKEVSLPLHCLAPRGRIVVHWHGYKQCGCVRHQVSRIRGESPQHLLGIDRRMKRTPAQPCVCRPGKNTIGTTNLCCS